MRELYDACWEMYYSFPIAYCYICIMSMICGATFYGLCEASWKSWKEFNEVMKYGTKKGKDK